MKNKKSKEGKHFKKKKKISFYPIFLILSIIITIKCVIYIYDWKKDSNHNEEIMNSIKDTIVENANETEINFVELKKINQDVVGWLTVKNTNIDYPIVQGNDNNYYLNYSFDKQYNKHGWPFVDYTVKLDGTDKNITIYGHNIKDDSMFGSLKNILDPQWYNDEENLTIDFITEEESQKYKVFSIYNIEKETYYTNNYFKDDAEYKDFLNKIQSRSIVDFNEDVDENDKIITLSTCADNSNYRIVLHAKRIE